MASKLEDQLNAFYAFARRRVNDPALAQDLAHDALLKAIERNAEIPEEKLTPWVFRTLRNAAIDLYRGKDAADRALEKLASGFVEQAGPADERELCGCIASHLEKLKPAYADVLKRVDFDGIPLADYAASKAKSQNTMRVKLHRAREQMRNALKRSCGVCANHGCLDCECAPKR